MHNINGGECGTKSMLQLGRLLLEPMTRPAAVDLLKHRRLKCSLTTKLGFQREMLQPTVSRQLQTLTVCADIASRSSSRRRSSHVIIHKFIFQARDIDCPTIVLAVISALSSVTSEISSISLTFLHAPFGRWDGAGRAMDCLPNDARYICINCVCIFQVRQTRNFRHINRPKILPKHLARSLSFPSRKCRC